LRIKILSALSDPARLELLEYLSGGERCVCEILPAFQRSQSTISKHLNILHEADILERKVEGKRVQESARLQLSSSPVQPSTSWPSSSLRGCWPRPGHSQGSGGSVDGWAGVGRRLERPEMQVVMASLNSSRTHDPDLILLSCRYMDFAWQKVRSKPHQLDGRVVLEDLHLEKR
jgi:hypothetical protein